MDPCTTARSTTLRILTVNTNTTNTASKNDGGEKERRRRFRPRAGSESSSMSSPSRHRCGGSAITKLFLVAVLSATATSSACIGGGVGGGGTTAGGIARNRRFRYDPPASSSSSSSSSSSISSTAPVVGATTRIIPPLFTQRIRRDAFAAAAAAAATTTTTATAKSAAFVGYDPYPRRSSPLYRRTKRRGRRRRPVQRPQPTATPQGRPSAAATSFSRVPSSTVLFESRSSSEPNGAAGTSASIEAARAGEAGYSLLRQPLSKSNWDPDVQPEFDIPSSLQDDDGSGRSYGGQRQDEEWWKRGVSSSSSTGTDKKNEQPQLQQQSLRVQQRTRKGDVDVDDASAAKDLDLFQRTLDTLDYPRVLRSLEKECATPAAKRIVRDACAATASTAAASGATAGASGVGTGRADGPAAAALVAAAAAAVPDVRTPRRGSLRGVPPHQRRAYQALTADSVQGAQERYQAVRELQFLYDNRDVRLVDLSDYTFRDATSRGGYGGGTKQNLANVVMPSLSTGEIDLQLLLQVAGDYRRVLEGEEIVDVIRAIDTFETIRNWGQALRQINQDLQNGVGAKSTDNSEESSPVIEFVELPAWADCVTVNETLRDLLENAFEKPTNGANNNNNQRPQLSGGTFPSIGRLRARIKSLRANILDTLEGLLSLPSMRSKLALESGGPTYSETNGRLVIPVIPAQANAVGIVHDTSRSGKTCYVEPTEVVSATNQLKQAENELRTEEGRVWKLLTEQILANRISLTTSALALAQLDLVRARLRLGDVLQGVIPRVENQGVIQLRNAKHPVLLLRGVENVVGSDIDLGANGNQGLVLTGPNSGGKTIILKLLGLVSYMSKCGIPVPADPTPVRSVFDDGDGDDDDASEGNRMGRYVPRVDYFDPILADIGDIQSVSGDLSTFSGHMLVCREVLNNAGENALVLMDEVGSGTDPNQGVAIAQALLEALVDGGARVAITTHFMALKQLAASDERFSVGGMQFINGKPTYKLLPGTVGESFALAVAERLELPRPVIARATELLDVETRQMGELIRELEDQKSVLDQQVLQLEEKKKEMASMEQKIKEEYARLERKQLNARRDEAKKFAQKLEEKEAVLEDILNKLKSDPSRRIIAKSWDDIKFTKRDALNEAENVPSVLARKKKQEQAMEEVRAELVPIAELRDKPDLNPGDVVTVCKKGPLLGREGTVVKALSGRVEVRVNNMNVGFKMTEIAIPVKGGRVHLQDTSSSGPPSASSNGKNSMSKAAERALADERKANRIGRGRSQSFSNDESDGANGGKSSKTIAIRTQSNTIDVRGCNLEEAKDKVTEKISRTLMSGGGAVYVLHGHGSGGVLKSKIRNWLASMQKSKGPAVVKNWKPADTSDGGDAFTLVELR